MTKTNYKLIAKKNLEKISNDYEELKIKSNDPYFECDEYICNIADLENWLNNNGDYRVEYQHPKLLHTKNIFEDLNIIDENIQHKKMKIEFLKSQIDDLKVEKTNILRENLKLEDNKINKIRFTKIPRNRKEIEIFYSKVREIKNKKLYICI
tara:strand:+ start:43 stop:498 length:456 start_codon:yes stop_codon:yes gene_type:complete